MSEQQEQAMQQLGKVLSQSITIGLLKFGAIMGVGILAAGFILDAAIERPTDSTDSTEARSGMGLHTDALTGCQYLSTPKGGITPRLDASGRHLCGDMEPAARCEPGELIDGVQFPDNCPDERVYR